MGDIYETAESEAIEFNKISKSVVSLDSISSSSVPVEQTLHTNPFETDQQKMRDSAITSLLEEYVDSYKRKIKQSSFCRYLILSLCSLIVIAFAVVLIVFSVQIARVSEDINITNLAAFITACVSFISLIVGLLTIITKYFFPEDDEQYITKIVETIQKNDLETQRLVADSVVDREAVDKKEKT